MTERLLGCPGSRYEYETKMLILCAEEHIPIHEVPIETIYLNDNASSHFNPIKDSYRIYRLFFGTFVKFLLSSVSSALIDLLLFNLLIHHVFGVDTTHIFLATAIARVCSSIYNFLMNQKVVFASRGGTGAALVKLRARRRADALLGGACLPADVPPAAHAHAQQAHRRYAALLLQLRNPEAVHFPEQAELTGNAPGFFRVGRKTIHNNMPCLGSPFGRAVTAGD